VHYKYLGKKSKDNNPHNLLQPLGSTMISILYVDDETVLLEVTRVYLERTGEFSVATCTSANEALSFLETTTFDAIVSDYQMPVMDGLEFLKYIRTSGNTVPFILFTGKGREEVAIEALNSGADFYLQKGGEPKSQFAELVNKIRQAVQRWQAVRALAASEEKYRGIFDNAPMGIFHSTPEGSIVDTNPVFARMFGYDSPEELREMVNRKGIAEMLYHDFGNRADFIRQVQESGGWESFGTLFRKKDGSTFTGMLSFRMYANPSGGQALEGFVVDITESQKAQARIAASEQRYHNIFDAGGDAMLVLDGDTGAILDGNPAAVRLFGYSVNELKNLQHRSLFAEEMSLEITGTQTPFQPLVHYVRKDGSAFAAETTSSHYPQKKRTISIVSIRDITERIKAEERMVAAQRLYAVLSQINQAIVRVKDLQTLVDEICRVSIDYGRFRMAWVGLLDRDTRTLRPVALAGHDDGYLEAIEIAVKAADAKSRGPTGVALIEGRYDICNDIGSDPRMEPWREEALKRGYCSSAAFPFRLHGEVVGAYMLYASEKNFFNEAEIALLEEIALDISFALDLLDEQARRTHAEKALAGSEERAGFLAGVLESSSQSFGVGYPDGSFGIVNPALCDLLGYAEEELHQLTWSGITPPEFADLERAVLEELLTTGIPQRYEKEYLRKDGSRVPVEIFVHRVIDKGGNLQYYYAFVTDITGRRQAEEAIKRERNQAQRYLDTAGVMLAALDTDGTITLINRKGCEILGYTEGELLGRNWLSTCLPERVREDVREVFLQITCGNSSLVEYHENPVLTKDGKERILAFHNTLILDAGSPITGILFSGEDITPRKQMEDALKESEERFRNLIQNASDMIRIIGRSGLIEYSSPSTGRITGFDPSDMLGKNPLDFVHPDDHERVQAALAEVFGKTNPGAPTAYRIRHRDGHYIDVEATAVNLLDVPGINGVVTTTRPVTERRKAEQDLLETEGRYRAIFEKSADAIFVIGENFLDCNPAAEHLLGCSRDEIIGKSPDDFSPPAQPGGRASPDLVREYIRAARDGTTRTFTWVHCRKDGSLFPAQVTLIPAHILGEQRLISLVHDCSIQDREEQHSRHLARLPELNPDPVIEVHRNREISYANPASRTILQNLGMPADPAAFIPEDFDALVIAIQAETSSSVYREIRIGTALFGETLSFDPEDNTVRIYAHDITTRVFEKSALEQANRKLNILSGITRHDIKNKLTGVMGYLELSRGSTRDPELIEYLSRAELSATAIRQQIEFTKEYENLGMKAPVWQELSRVLESEVRHLDRGKVTVLDQTAGLQLYADPMLPKVICGLLENALAHGKQLTTIRIHGSPAPAGYLLVVEDDGVGIPAGLKEKIFNKKVGSESGFGLFLSREILSITGITIEETGEPGKCARFEISVPNGKFQIK
jgi:PAS domain S-box-containing protein